jgi:hypothetical protein
LSLFLKLLNGPLVNATTLVDEVASGGGLAGVHMANHHNIDVDLLFAHCENNTRPRNFSETELKFLEVPRGEEQKGQNLLRSSS